MSPLNVCVIFLCQHGRRWRRSFFSTSSVLMQKHWCGPVWFDICAPRFPMRRDRFLSILHSVVGRIVQSSHKIFDRWRMYPFVCSSFFFRSHNEKRNIAQLAFSSSILKKVAAIAAVWLPVVRWTRTLFSVSSRARRLLGGWLPSAELIELCTQDARITPTGPTHAWIRDAGHEEVKERNCVNQAHPSSLPGETARATSSLCPLIYSQVYKYSSSSSSPLSRETLRDLCGILRRKRLGSIQPKMPRARETPRFSFLAFLQSPLTQPTDCFRYLHFSLVSTRILRKCGKRERYMNSKGFVFFFFFRMTAL